MSEISDASQEQTAGIEQINQAVTQLDQTTRQNASLVEQAGTAADAFQRQVLMARAIMSPVRTSRAEYTQRTDRPVRATVFANDHQIAAAAAEAKKEAKKIPGNSLFIERRGGLELPLPQAG